MIIYNNWEERLETNDFWDATNSWSGYNYQGKIALYYGIRKINELITIGKACDIEKYAIEIEWKEDFSYCIYRR